MTFSNKQKLDEVKRELAMRARVYPRWIEAGKITLAEAERRNDILLDIARDYDRLVDAEEPDLFSERRV